MNSAVITLTLIPGSTSAGPVASGSIEVREAKLDPAEYRRIGSGNPDADDIGSYWVRDEAWQDAGHIDEYANDPDGDGGVDYEDVFLSFVFNSG